MTIASRAAVVHTKTIAPAARGPSTARLRSAPVAVTMRMWGCLCAIAALLFASPSHAHLNTTGLGPVYDGIAHFALTPEDFLPALALALLAGLRGAAHGRAAIVVLPLAWLVGGLIGLAANAPIGASLAWVPLLILGGLVAADIRLSMAVTAALAALLGLFHGYLNGSTLGQGGPGALALVGIAGTAFVFVTLVVALVAAMKSHWARIAGRVAGSWIAASGLLLLGWSLAR